MTDWWQSLSGLNQTLYGLAICISVPFAWQFAAALLGLSHDGDLDGTEGDTDAEAAPGDAVATALAFKLLSMRALITFFTLFFWAAALYLERGLPLPRVFGSAVVWGLGGMSSVALLLHLLPRLAHSGTRDLDSALGSEATVYIDIPFGGTGEVRALVSGSVGYIKARSLDGGAIPSGTPVAVRRRIGQTLLVVEPVIPTQSTGECT